MGEVDVICVGNVLIDIFLRIEDENKHLSLNAQKEILIKLGDKIPVDKHEFSIGGNAANTSIGLARLGHVVSLAAETGYDEFLGKITKTLEIEGVNQSLLRRAERRDSSFSVILNYKGDRTIFKVQT